jgi:alpha-L-fucosidase
MTLYLHVWEWPADGKILLPGVQQPARSSRMLTGTATVSSTVTEQGLLVTMPGAAPDPDVSVAALEFDKAVQIFATAAPSSMGTPLDPNGGTAPKQP